MGLTTLAVVAAISFPTGDGGVIHADLYGAGERAIVLAHGGRFDKGSWKPQAEVLAGAGFRVLAIDFRGYGASKGPGDSDPLSAPLHLDLLGAARYLKGEGARTVSIVGASMGGGAAAKAAAEAAPGTIDRVVMIASDWIPSPEAIKGRKLFIAARDDPSSSGAPRLVRIREIYAKAPEPKELVVLEGTAHAQAIFTTEQGERLLREIVRFLNES